MKYLLAFWLVFSCLALTAQFSSPFQNFRHSSRDQNGNLHIRFDLDPEMGFTDFSLFHNSGAGWQETAFVNLPEAGLEALLPYEWNQTLEYRARTEVSYDTELISYQHQAYLNQDVFPPAINNMANLGDDPVGDSLMIYNTALDLTQSYIASGPQKLYRMLRSQSGTYPTFVNLTTYNVYLCSITNPEVMSDSISYAMIYSFNIPGVLSTGLYKLGVGEDGNPTFTRLGNVQNQVVGGALYLSCNMSDLTGDADFGVWPNLSSSLVFGDMTIRISMDLVGMEPDFRVADYGGTGVVEFKRYLYQVAQNNLPSLELVSYDPDTEAVVLSYTDPEQDFPLVAQLYVNDMMGGFTYMDMFPIYNPDGSASFYTYGSPENTSFRVSDNGIDFVQLSNWVANQDQHIPVLPSLSIRYPNPIGRGSGDFRILLQGLQDDHLTVDLYNIRGQKITRWAEQRTPAGELVLNVGGSQMRELSPGLYFIQVNQGGIRQIKRLIVTQ